MIYFIVFNRYHKTHWSVKQNVSQVICEDNKEIKKFYWKYICKQKVRKKGGGKSVPRAPVGYMWGLSFYSHMGSNCMTASFH